MRGDCLFCWYWWNWWPSLFKLSLCERWLFFCWYLWNWWPLLLTFFRWEVIVCFVDICGIDDHYSVGNDRSPNTSGNCRWRVRSTLYSPVWRVTVVRRLNETRFGPKKKSSPKNLDTFWCTEWAWNCQIIFRCASIHGRAGFIS